MQIHVSREDIDKGVRCKPCECPVARALRRHTGAKYVAVGCFLVTVEDASTDTPLEVLLFMRHYDAGGDCKPFTFDLPI